MEKLSAQVDLGGEAVEDGRELKDCLTGRKGYEGTQNRLEKAFVMEYVGLCGKIEEKIAECREKYERDRKDPYLSHVRNSELERMEAFYENIRKEGSSALRQSDLKDRLAELEIEKKREEEYPSFDWYGEHYHYLVLEGQCDAYRSMIELLEENEKEREVTKSNEKQRTEQEGQHDS